MADRANHLEPWAQERPTLAGDGIPPPVRRSAPQWEQIGDDRYPVEQYEPPGGLDPLALLGTRFGFTRMPQSAIYSLSPNTMNSPDGLSRHFRYNILRDGQDVGRIWGHVPNGLQGPWGQAPADRAFISNITGINRSGPNHFGPGAMRQLREAFRRDFPEVTNFTGWRNSGARPSGFRQDVTMPSLLAPLATGGLLPHADDEWRPPTLSGY